MALLYEAMAATITAKRLETPLDRARWLDAADAPRAAAFELAEKDFDQALVGSSLSGYSAAGPYLLAPERIGVPAASRLQAS